jgi:uroporphyrinogen III methyltransferase/synthase
VSPTRSKPRPHPVVLLGAGPGDPDLLSRRALQALGTADVVACHAERYADLVLAECRPDVTVLDTVTFDDASAEAKALAGHAKEGRAVVRIFTGDPFLGCAGAALAAALAKTKTPIEVVPGVPAATGVPAYAGVPLTEGAGGDVRIVDLADGAVEADWAAVTAGQPTLVVQSLDVSAGVPAAVGNLADALVSAGLKDTTPVAVTTAGSTSDQETVVSTLSGVAAVAKDSGLSGPVLVVVGDTVRRHERLSWFETRPLFGWRVLVPRTKEQAGVLSEQLRSFGAIPVEVPTISVEPPRTPAQMDRAIQGLFSGRYQWVVFTSTNAVKAVVEKFLERGLDARAFAGVKVAAVGEQTAAALVGFGVHPDLVPSGEQSSEGLVEVFDDYDDVLDPINRILLPRADIATETLAAGLTERGWECEDVTAYRTVRAAPPPAEIRDAIKTGGFDAVLFTSSSTVRNLVGIAGKPHASTVVAVIGPQTAATAAEMGLRVDVQAPSPAVGVLVEALADFAVAEREELAANPPSKAKAKAKLRGAARRKAR